MSKKILIVDDEEVLCDLLGETLHAAGYIITKAYDGQTAVDLLQNNKYDLAIIDLFLPIKTGIEIMQFIQESKIKIDVIMASGYTEASIAAEALKLGVRDFLIKPFNIKALKADIQKIFNSDIQMGSISNIENGSANINGNIPADENIVTIKTEKIENFTYDTPGVENLDFEAKSIGKDTILSALKTNNWNKSKAADNLGISLRSLYSIIKEYDLES
jgi:DNA-binding NtrC family response regulator